MKKIDDDDDSVVTTSTKAIPWTVGTARNQGSIHTDFWKTTAAELAESKFIAVYPGSGWWKDRPQFGMEKHNIRYSMIVSLELFTKTLIDIYTPIVHMIQTTIPVNRE